MNDRCEIRVGTSGWHYKHWCGPFYDAKTPGSRMLAHYIRHFDTVEINNSFYRLPAADAFSAWREATPADFCFAVKASRFITHMKKLKDPQNALDNFLPRAEVLGEKLGPILFQLPPHWPLNVARLTEFLSVLPKAHRYAFEFREHSWHVPEVYKVLRDHNAAFCVFELAGRHTPIEITADWTYIRLHGPEGPYQGSYAHQQLERRAERIVEWSAKLKAIYIYFDNDQAAYAAQNARTLKSLLSSATAGAA